MNGMAFQHYLKCLIFFLEFFGIISYNLLTTNSLMFNFFGKRPAPERPMFKSNPFPAQNGKWDKQAVFLNSPMLLSKYCSA
jgi:hypothetical protein